MRETSSVTSICAGSTAYSVPANSKGSRTTPSTRRRPSPLESLSRSRSKLSVRAAMPSRVDHGAVRAMVLDEPGRPLQPRELPDPRLDPGRPGDVLVEVHACGVCRTDLHIRDGELRGSRLPVVPGHQIVATVLQAGPDAEHEPGARVGIPWLGWTDGTCRFCTSGRENLCEHAQFTGLDRDGGYATHAVADGRYALALPEGFGD